MAMRATAVRLVEVLEPAAPAVSISVIHPRPGMLDALLAAQAAQHRLEGRVAGLRGVRCLRAGDVVVVITTFNDPLDVLAFARDPRRLAYLERIRPLVERVETDVFEEVYASGTL
ncbi:hypothetical protein [Caulobacter segnis]